MGSVETMWALSSYTRGMQKQPVWALLAAAWLKIQTVKEARMGGKLLQMGLFQVESMILNRILFFRLTLSFLNFFFFFVNFENSFSP